MLKSLLNSIPWWLGWILWPLSLGIIPDGLPSPANLIVLPVAPLNFETIPLGASSQFQVIVSNYGGTFTNVTNITIGGAPFSLIGLPGFPKRLNPGDFFSFTLKYTPTGAVTSNDTLTVTTTTGCNNSPFSGSISGTGIAAASASVSVTPGTCTFYPFQKIGTTSANLLVTINNGGTGNVTVNTIALAGGTQFAINTINPALPATLTPGQTVTFNLVFSPTVGGILTDTINVGTTANSPAVPVSGYGTPVVSVFIVSQNVRQVVFGLTDTVPNVLTKFLDATNLSGLLSSTSTLSGLIQFNGSIWNNPGFEKALRRIQVFYENVGVGSITCTVLAWRPSVGVDSFDSKTQTINLGTPLADSSERSAFFDIQIAGEILVMQISRPVSGGPLSILGFLPLFEDKGEKVENI